MSGRLGLLAPHSDVIWKTGRRSIVVTGNRSGIGQIGVA